MNRFLDFFEKWWKKWNRYVLLLVIIAILVVIFCYKAKSADMPEIENIESQQIYIFNTVEVQNLLAWITIITVPYTAGWAIYQYKKSVTLRQQEKAAEIAKLFADELLVKCDIVNNVILKSGLKELYKLDKIDLNNLQRFDKAEIIELYEKEGKNNFYEKYDAIINDDLIQTMYLNYLEFLALMI